MLGIPYERGKHDLKIDWKSLLLHGSILQHKQRRKLFKKIKRSCKRRTLAARNHVETSESSSDDTEEKIQTTFYDTVAALRKANKCIFPINNPVLQNRSTVTTGDDSTKRHLNGVDEVYNGQNDEVTCQNGGSESPERPATSSLKESGSVDNAEDEVITDDRDSNDATKDAEVAKLLHDLDEEVKEWHNPFLPERQEHSKQTSKNYHSEMSQLQITEKAPKLNSDTPQKPICQFYEKVGSCRFGDHCSRHHNQVSLGTVLLLHGMFTTFAFDMLQRARRNGGVGDLSLEHSDADLFDEFIEFSDDVLPELETYGKVTQFKVCCNRSQHLLGNVYVQYQNEKEAKHAAEVLNKRFYGGKRLHAQFVSIKSWKNAICGLHYNNRTCPRGSQCNFLHVFKHPSRKFHYADTDAESHRDSKPRDYHHISRRDDRNRRKKHEYNPRKRSPTRRSFYRRSSSREHDAPEFKRHKKESKKHKKKTKEAGKKDHKHKKHKKNKKS